MKESISNYLKQLVSKQEAIQLEIDIDEATGLITEHPTDPITGMIMKDIPDLKDSSIVPAPD